MRTSRKAHALFLRGLIRLRMGDLDAAMAFLEKAGNLCPNLVLIRLWFAVARYTKACCSCPEDSLAHRKEITLTILDLEGIVHSVKPKTRNRDEEKAFRMSLSLLGSLYCKIGDFISAKERLEQLLSIDAHSEYERNLLGHIWNHRMRPLWWQWWFCSPPHLARWPKIIVGGVLCYLLFIEGALLFFHAIVHYAASSIANVLPWVAPVVHDWRLTYLYVFILLFLLLSPVLRRLKVRDIEFEILPPTFEPIVSAAAMGRMLYHFEERRPMSAKTSGFATTSRS
jgi:tetratricopeptide (TPR) repeat protein